MMHVRAKPAARLAAALGLLAMVLLASTAPLGSDQPGDTRISMVSTDLTEKPIEALGHRLPRPILSVPAPRAGRLKVREADRVGPHRLHLPPPATV